MTSKAVRVNTTEEGDKDCDVPIVMDTNKNKKRCLCLSGCGGLVILVLLTTTIILAVMVSNQRQNDDDPNKFISDKESAANILDHLKTNSSGFDSFDEAFNVFDDDKDGYLNQTEFAKYFEIEIEHSATFPKIDADNDGILSYPEVVTYVSQLSQIDIIFSTVFKEYIIPLMISKYNYQYSTNETAVVDTLFNEYASMIMYFDIYDLDLNGYIRYDEYSSISIKNDFKFADINSDNKLSKDELFNLLYSDAMDNHHHSFSGALNEIFHNDANAVQLFGKSLVDISITREQVMNINLNLCPLQSQSHNGDRRRLNEGSCNGCPITLPYNCREVCWCEGNIAPCCFELCDYFTICLPPGSCIPGR